MKIIRRAKKSVSSLLNSRPRKKTIESELLASCLVGDGREEQCASSEAPVKLPQSRPGHWTPGRGMASCSRSERDGETDMHGCVGKRQSNPCIDRNLLYLQVPSDETILSLIIFFIKINIYSLRPEI